MKCVINSFELLLYYCIWISLIIRSLSKLLEFQSETFIKNPHLQFSLSNLLPGWSFLNRKKDCSDFEWICWKYYIQTSWCYLLFNFLVSESLRKFNFPIIKYWYILSSINYVLLYMGVKQLMFILIPPFLFFILIIIYGGKQIGVWITSLILLLTYNTLKFKHFLWKFVDDGSSQDEKIVLLLFAMGLIQLRCISFCLDYVERPEKTKSGKKCYSKEKISQIFTNLFSYVLYLPLLYVGPIMLYEDFNNSFQCRNEKLWPRLKRFTVDAVLFLIYSLLLELALHYVYFYAMHADLKLIKQLPPLALAGGGIWMGFQFHVKYVIAYGTTSAFSRLDNMEPPPTPRCLARIHVYSQLWRYFDVGLYKFLVKYIFKPGYITLYKYVNFSKILCKSIVSFSIFAFIFVLHGTTLNTFIWCFFNYCSIVLENIGKAVSTTEWYRNFKQKVLKTEAMEIRFIAGLCAFLLAMSAISNFHILFGGKEISHIYNALLNWPAPQNVLLVLISTYCCCHVSMTFLDTPSRTDVKRRKFLKKENSHLESIPRPLGKLFALPTVPSEVMPQHLHKTTKVKAE